MRSVAEDGAVTVTSDGTAVAHIIPAVPLPQTLAQLIATGSAIAPTISGPVTLPRPTAHTDVDIAAAMEADRQAERW